MANANHFKNLLLFESPKKSKMALHIAIAVNRNVSYASFSHCLNSHPRDAWSALDRCAYTAVFLYSQTFSLVSKARRHTRLNSKVSCWVGILSLTLGNTLEVEWPNAISFCEDEFAEELCAFFRSLARVLARKFFFVVLSETTRVFEGHEVTISS